MVYTNRIGAATSIADKHDRINATEVASPREIQSGAATLVAKESDRTNATEVASPVKGETT